MKIEVFFHENSPLEARTRARAREYAVLCCDAL